MAQKPDDKVYIEYVGPKSPMRVQFPVPFISASSKKGDPVEWSEKNNHRAAVTPEQAKQLLKLLPEKDNPFKLVKKNDPAVRQEAPVEEAEEVVSAESIYEQFMTAEPLGASASEEIHVND